MTNLTDNMNHAFGLHEICGQLNAVDVLLQRISDRISESIISDYATVWHNNPDEAQASLDGITQMRGIGETLDVALHAKIDELEAAEIAAGLLKNEEGARRHLELIEKVRAEVAIAKHAIADLQCDDGSTEHYLARQRLKNTLGDAQAKLAALVVADELERASR